MDDPVFYGSWTGFAIWQVSNIIYDIVRNIWARAYIADPPPR